MDMLHRCPYVKAADLGQKADSSGDRSRSYSMELLAAWTASRARIAVPCEYIPGIKGACEYPLYPLYPFPFPFAFPVFAGGREPGAGENGCAAPILYCGADGGACHAVCWGVPQLGWLAGAGSGGLRCQHCPYHLDWRSIPGWLSTLTTAQHQRDGCLLAVVLLAAVWEVVCLATALVQLVLPVVDYSHCSDQNHCLEQH